MYEKDGAHHESISGYLCSVLFQEIGAENKKKHFGLSIRTVRNQELCNNNPQQIQADVRAKPTALIQGIGKDVPPIPTWAPGTWEIPNWLSQKSSWVFVCWYTQLSNEKNLGWLDYIGDYTTQLYGDFNTPL